MRWPLNAQLTRAREADGEVVWTIFWSSVKYAEAKKTLQNKDFCASLMHGISAGFAISRARPKARS
ncbi:hypothetical protein UP10_18840 [Bradyrhizobium sp. LTSPM299]|nr:hypothetical protein UP10_18840 [Bradyrhizobium sp. LTSPM299]